MISASHNPYYDNGIKIFNCEGYKLSDQLEEEIEAIILNNDFGPLPSDHEIGRNKRIDDIAGRYIENVKATIPKGQSLNGIRLCLDCANGATYKVAPLVFWELGAEIIVKNDNPNGLNINDGCGALFPAELQKSVVQQQAHIGLAFDGDGDRLQLIDEHGMLVDGDQILAICAKHMLEKKLLKTPRVVVTVMSNYGLIKYLASLGLEVITAKVGDRHVLQKMLDHDAYLGAEPSGHIIFREHSTTGDGIIASLQVLSIMQKTGKTLSELARVLNKYPQTLINVPVEKKIPFEQIGSLQKLIETMEQELKGEGRILVRYSGTEDLCRVMVEGQDALLVQQLCQRIATVIEDEIGICAVL